MARNWFFSDLVGMPASLVEPGHVDSRGAQFLRGLDKSAPPKVNLLRQAAIGSRSNIAFGDARTAPLRQPLASVGGQLNTAASTRFGGSSSRLVAVDS
jgi:hypothetical protein